VDVKTGADAAPTAPESGPPWAVAAAVGSVFVSTVEATEEEKRALLEEGAKFCWLPGPPIEEDKLEPNGVNNSTRDFISSGERGSEEERVL